MLAVCTGNVHYYAQTDQLDELGKNVLINEYINPSTVEYWYFDYKKWLNESGKHIISEYSDQLLYQFVLAL